MAMTTLERPPLAPARALRDAPAAADDGARPHLLDVLVPTCNRPAALAATLATLACQGFRDFRLVVADQSDGAEALAEPAVLAAIRMIEVHGQPVAVYRRPERRGMAEQRAFLLEQARAPYALFLDDDLLLEPFVLQEMLSVIRVEQCGFVGSAVIGLSYRDDVRPHEQAVEFIDGPVRPERVRPGMPSFERYKLHNAANLWHVQRALTGYSPGNPARYRVAWVGGCVMYDVHKLRDCGGFDFWQDLPHAHAGEDVLAQLRVMERYGGCGILPSGVYHQEHPTTVTDRRVDAPRVLLAADLG
ncbi:MAG: glycosyltransferase [Dehalococcoidia bacterium]